MTTDPVTVNTADRSLVFPGPTGTRRHPVPPNAYGSAPMSEQDAETTEAARRERLNIKPNGWPK